MCSCPKYIPGTSQQLITGADCQTQSVNVGPNNPVYSFTLEGGQFEHFHYDGGNDVLEIFNSDPSQWFDLYINFGFRHAPNRFGYDLHLRVPTGIKLSHEFDSRMGSGFIANIHFPFAETQTANVITIQTNPTGRFMLGNRFTPENPGMLLTVAFVPVALVVLGLAALCRKARSSSN